MTGDIFLALFIAVPIVVLTAAFVYHMSKRREDIDHMDQYKQSMRDEEPQRRDRSVANGPSGEHLDRVR